MPEGLGGLIAVTAIGAALIVAHVALLAAVVRSEVEAKWKWAALVPIVTPIAAWVAPRRRHLAAWSALLVAYVVARALW